MKPEYIIDALGYIDEDMILETDKIRHLSKKKKTHWQYYFAPIALVSCLVLFIHTQNLQMKNQYATITTNEAAEADAEYEEAPAEGEMISVYPIMPYETDSLLAKDAEKYDVDSIATTETATESAGAFTGNSYGTSGSFEITISEEEAIKQLNLSDEVVNVHLEYLENNGYTIPYYIIYVQTSEDKYMVYSVPAIEVNYLEGE